MSKLKTAFALTAMTLLNAACSSGEDTSDSDTGKVQSNRIILQAENWTSNASTATLNWLPIYLDNDYGQAAKLVSRDAAQWSHTGLPTLTYNIEFLQIGTYALNVHGRHDSNYALLPDQQTVITFGSDGGDVELVVDGFDDQWQWLNSDIFGQSLTIEIKTPGDHLFKIASATTGLMLNQISIDRLINTTPETNNGTTTTEFVANPPTTVENDSTSGEITTTPPTGSTENTAPIVTIDGPLQATTGQAVTLLATATDDGKPHNSIYYYWSAISGPADVIISNRQSARTQVTFSAPGNYLLQVSANDGQSYNNATRSINITAQTTTVQVPAQRGNTAPAITSIPPVSAEVGKAVSLTATATDDSLPHGGIYYYWSKLSGPGTVAFSAMNTAATHATFSTPGTYKLQLNASDGKLYSNLQISIVVAASQSAVDTGSTTQTGTAQTTTDANRLGNNWTTITATGNVTARHEAGGVEVDGKLYVLGGRGNRPVDRYDPNTGQWTTVAQAPMEMHHFQPVAIGSKIYVIAAFTCCYPKEKIIGDIYTFDTRNNQWSKGSKIPANRQRGSAAAAVRNGKIYLLGGNTNGHSGGAVRWFDEFDPQTGNWKTLPDAPDARDHATIAISNNKLVAAAGRESNYPNTFHKTVSRTNVYDFNTGNWQTEANIPTARAGTMTVAHGAEVLVIGGESAASNFAHDNVEAYNVHSKKWRKLKSLNAGRHGGAAVFLNSLLHVVTGSERRGAGNESTAHEVLK